MKSIGTKSITGLLGCFLQNQPITSMSIQSRAVILIENTKTLQKPTDSIYSIQPSHVISSIQPPHVIYSIQSTHVIYSIQSPHVLQLSTSSAARSLRKHLANVQFLPH